MTSPEPFRVLVTGAEGFVGKHLLTALLDDLPPQSTVIGCGRQRVPLLDGVVGVRLDVTREAEVAAVIARFEPSHVFHLAALSHVQHAEQNAQLAWQINLLGTLNIPEGILRTAPK